MCTIASMSARTVGTQVTSMFVGNAMRMKFVSTLSLTRGALAFGESVAAIRGDLFLVQRTRLLAEDFKHFSVHRPEA